MKKLTQIFVLMAMATLTILSSCEKNTLKSGITGTLQYGEGSCLFDQSSRTYTPFSGEIHFVNSAVKDTFSGPLNQLLNISDSTIANAGKFKVKLEPGNYYLCIRLYSVIIEENKFIVQPNATTEQNFWIFKCI